MLPVVPLDRTRQPGVFQARRDSANVPAELESIPWCGGQLIAVLSAISSRESSDTPFHSRRNSHSVSGVLGRPGFSVSGVYSNMSAVDAFNKHGRSLTSPPENAAPLQPSDTEQVRQVTRAVFVGGEGDLRVQMLGGGVVTFTGVPGGSLLPLRVVQIFASGTSATELVGLW